VCKRKYLIAGLLGMFAALLFGGTASGTVTGQTYTATVSPHKQDRRTFGRVSLTNVIDTQYQDLNSNPDQLTLTFSKDISFKLGHAPECDLADIESRSTASARFACPSSVMGQGSAQIVFAGVPCCLLTGDAVVTLFNGPRSPSPTVYLHFDVSQGSLVVDFVGSLNTQANTLTFGRLPSNGFEFPHLDLTIQGSWVRGAVWQRKTYWVTARCKEGKWINSATAHFLDGSTRTAYSTQKCTRKS
jgi:hypothetical protein